MSQHKCEAKRAVSITNEMGGNLRKILLEGDAIYAIQES
jgi:hypothetical protein